MTTWLRQMEDFLETVDRTAANVAVVRGERGGAERPSKSSSVDEHLHALEAVGLPKEGAGAQTAEKLLSASRPPKSPGSDATSRAASLFSLPGGVKAVPLPASSRAGGVSLGSLDQREAGGGLQGAEDSSGTQEAAKPEAAVGGEKLPAVRAPRSDNSASEIRDANGAAASALPAVRGDADGLAKPAGDSRDAATPVLGSRRGEGRMHSSEGRDGLSDPENEAGAAGRGSEGSWDPPANETLPPSPPALNDVFPTPPPSVSVPAAGLPAVESLSLLPPLPMVPSTTPASTGIEHRQANGSDAVPTPSPATDGGGSGQGAASLVTPGASATPAVVAALPEIPKTAAVQRELDEARGLLKNAPSMGQTKEARLTRICAQLSQRVQEYKAENAQLEELLRLERNGRGSMDSTAKSLEQQLALALAELAAAEASTGAALSAKNAELEAVQVALVEAKRQGALLEGKLASAQANSEVISKNRDLTEARMIQALREELASVERRFEDERIAHAASRQSTAQREIDLEQRVTESVAALSRMQRMVDERTQKAADLEDKISLLEVECASLNQEVQSMEAKMRREPKRGGEDSSMTAQVQAWRDEVERARHMQHEAEGKQAAMEAETQKLRVALEARNRELDSASVQAHVELEKRFRELTEVLYLKQMQLETVSSEKQAAVLQLERETRRFRESKAQAEKTSQRRMALSAEDDEQELRSFESSLGLSQRRIGPGIQQAAKLLDRGTVTAGRWLGRRPLARLGVLLYLVFVHLFLMYMLHRLQEQADIMLSKDRASIAAEADSGLMKPNHIGR
eukprot:TRINITY_DN11619_c0_g1_i1.p1 TRINITY_DN11619_c0_g1~~TRINITY_DN11619_c0_g1_i1.p1  ORF type:complete len:803 (+),score=219.44 TRINITY_DN11619_c0_g1_i1:127-2535(+)